MVAINLIKFLELGYDINKLHLIGHSLGGQCIGLVSRHLKKTSNDRYFIPRLYALDPAAPAFETNNTLSKALEWASPWNTDFPMISRDDAEYVQVIHTSAGTYGIIESRGHVDFFPNSGSNQHGCDLEITDDVCSHRRAWLYYQESVKVLNTFSAVKCESYEKFKSGACKGHERSFMGFSHNTSARGNFYLITHSNPYHTSLGENGIEYKKLIVITENGTLEQDEIAMGIFDFINDEIFEDDSGSEKFANQNVLLLFISVYIVNRIKLLL